MELLLDSVARWASKVGLHSVSFHVGEQMSVVFERLLGDVRGRHYTSVVAHEETRRARERFAQKVLAGASRPPRSQRCSPTVV
jgi:hypothetical protein